jgi:hypothetical protein
VTEIIEGASRAFNTLKHHLEKCVAVFPRDNVERVCAKIILNQRTKAGQRFIEISSRFIAWLRP